MTALSAEEIVLSDEIRKRFTVAKFDVTAIRLEGLPFKEVGEGCDLSDKPDDVAAVKINSYVYQDKNHDGEAYQFTIHRLGKFNGKLWEIVTMHGNYEPHVHKEADAQFVMLQGRGVALIGKDCIPYKAATVLEALANVSHGFITQEPTAFLSIQSRPIVCTPEGAHEPKADFYPVPKAPLPDWVETLYQGNRRLAVSPNT